MTWSIVQSDALEFLRAQPADSLDLVFGSPPYEMARLYLEGGKNLGIARKTDAWVSWMVEVFQASQAACKGLVAFVVAGQTKGFKWSAGPALLMAELHRSGMNLRNPPIYRRHGIPGSGGTDWLRSDYEWVVCTSRAGKLPWSDPTACGKPPKYGPGGEMSYRSANGDRKNGDRTRRDNRLTDRNGRVTEERQAYKPPVLANPGNVIRLKVGGGHMGGDQFSSQNEAPFPEKLAEFFVLSFCPPHVCQKCGTAVEYSDDYANLPVVQNGLPDVPEPCGSRRTVLLPGVFLPGTEEAAGQVSILSPADPAHPPQPEGGVLLKTLFEPGSGQEAAKPGPSDENEKGVHSALPPGASKCSQGRLCDGTPGCDGKTPEKAARKGRSRSSQKRQEGRQPAGESGTDGQAPTRLPAQAKASDHLPEVRPHDCPHPLCPSCGADLTRPGAIRAGLVCDPFSGSGTTATVAKRHGRNFTGCDLRESQVKLGLKRLACESEALFT